MTRYRFHWRDGSTTEGEGETPADALAQKALPPEKIAYMLKFEVLDGSGA